MLHPRSLTRWQSQTGYFYCKGGSINKTDNVEVFSIATVLFDDKVSVQVY